MAYVALVTGFEPYGGREINPASEVMKRIDGLDIEGTRVVGRALPVSFVALRSRTHEIMRELNPRVVVSLGLWPGEPVIRLERVAVNIADFEIPDNEGTVLRDELVQDAAPTAVASTLPLRAIQAALLSTGIPARLSASAGTFLCNAAMYTFLCTLQALAGARCGFVHLPYLPQQVATLLDDLAKEQQLELHQRANQYQPRLTRAPSISS